MNENERLFDLLTRHQIYLEGVKLDQVVQFNKVTRELVKEIRVLFSTIEYENLNDLKKVELQKLISSLKKIQKSIYSRFTDRLLDDIHAFIFADIDLNRSIFESVNSKTAKQAYLDEQGTPLATLAIALGIEDDVSQSFSNISNAPIPANGLLLLPFIGFFVASASTRVENVIRMGYANKWTVRETLNAIAGTGPRNYRDGAFSKTNRQANAVLSTAFQHVSSIVQGNIASIFYDNYVWNSVIDGATTEICFYRNGKIYKFRKGPLPPAHIFCRSGILPFSSRRGVSVIDTTYFKWLKSQPVLVQNDILGKRKAISLRKDVLKSKDFLKFRSEFPLSINDFKNKRSFILT